MSHAFYIYTAYGMTGLIMLVLIGWVFFDGRGLRADMQRLEAAGIRRRSSAQPSLPPQDGPSA